MLGLDRRIVWAIYQSDRQRKNGTFEGVFGASDVALGALESGVSFEKRILDIYQNCKNITAVRKAFAALNRQLDARKNAHVAELRSILLTESREAKGQALRYTLRLLTTQQRDRITKMILAAELIRQKEYPKYGKEPISIGFWVGGTVTPNTFKELEEAPEDPAKTRIARSKKNSIYKQLLTCPFCGKPLTEENFYIDIPTKSVSIYCSDDKCMFYRYKPSNKIKIPVYLVDEEIYAKCPTIILSTVDKFARLPWDVNTNALFGRVDRICSRDGYVAIGADHARHNRTEELPTSTLRSIKPFLPPELIIQDELHLITGPLGTVYGAYETVIEDLCSYTIGEKKIKPKYVVSTATIKNAAEQTKCLYGRKVTAQFPPNGFEIGDSFYIREVPVEQDPFTAKMDLMQRFFGFEQYIRAGAQKTIEIIRDLDIVDTVRYKAPYDEKVHDGSLY